MTMSFVNLYKTHTSYHCDSLSPNFTPLFTNFKLTFVSTINCTMGKAKNVYDKLPTKKKFIDTTSANEAKIFNRYLAQFIYGVNLPFRVVEGLTFKSFVKAIRPSYVKFLPSRKTLSTSLLEESYERVIELEKKNVENESCLLADSWKFGPSKDQHFAIMLHNANSNGQFVDSFDMTTTRESAENLETAICDAKAFCQTNYDTNCFCLVTDNAKNMQKAGRLVNHHMLYSNCNAHVANLLSKDVLNMSIKKQVDSILACFRGTHLLRHLENRGGKRILKPSDTRWCYHRDVYQNLIDNLDIMKSLANERDKNVDSEIKKLLLNDDFINKIRIEIKIQSPICNLINIFQKKETNLSTAAALWLDFNPPTDVPITKAMKIKYQNRKNMGLTKIALSAFYLDPKNDKRKLSSCQLSEVRNFMCSMLRGNLIDQFIGYSEGKEAFTKYLDKVKEGIEYWKMMEYAAPELSKLSLKLLKIPASTAQLERVFSL